MRQNLCKLFTLLFLIPAYQKTFSQVTQLSNNTNLSLGIVINGKALLLSHTDPSHNDSLWVTNGTAASTVRLTSTVSYVDTGGIAVYKGKLFFSGANSAKGAELWATDGTAAGTTLIKDIRTGTASSVPTNFFLFNNTLFFTANNGTNGRELWSTDGTSAGTKLVKDINAGSGSSFTNTALFFANNSILYFTANDGSHGTELWKTNGTAAGTTLVKDITTGNNGTEFTQFIGLGTQAIIGTKKSVSGDSQLELWKSNGTTAGTTLIKNFGFFSGSYPPTFYAFKGKIYFVGTDFTSTGSELWVTNGTTAGTILVKDIYSGSTSGFPNSSTPFLYNAVIINNKFYFMATDGKGAELWSSDGTAAGTTQLKDIRTGNAGSTPIIFKNYFTQGSPDTSLYNGKIFFSADDGTNGRELWITNGAAAGTTMVKDVRVGTTGGLENSFGYFYTSSGLYFGANNGTNGSEPWLSNATSAGTKLVANVNPGTKNSSPIFLFIFKNQLYFNATNGDNANKTDLYKINTTVSPLSALPVTAEAIQPANDELFELKLTPNPVKQQLNVRFSVKESKDVSLRIVDANGKSVFQQNLSGAKEYQHSINVTGLAKGIYYLQLITNKETRSAKFVKE